MSSQLDRFRRVVQKRLRALLGLSARAEPSLRQLRHLEHLAQTTAMDVAEIKLMLSALTLPDSSTWKNRPVMIEGAPGENAFPVSTICRQSSFEQPYFAFWTRTLGEGLRYHRKLWEFVFILQALWERGAIRPGARGLGFGVGQESMPAWFASQGVLVTATDMGAEEATEAGWVGMKDHAASKGALSRPYLCPPDVFERNVEFRPCDMNAVPDDLTGYDFCWSACAFEHLGSIEAGLRFVERSLDTLKPGGWAVHTSEYTMSSNDETVDTGPTVLFRRRDFEELQRRLEAKGHRVAPFDFTPGDGPIDRYLDILPFRTEPHVVLALWGHQTTSIGVIVQKGG